MDEELVVVDGGSKDDSVSIAREFTENVFSSKNGKGRGFAMNVGAQNAGGEILLFLHADCELPDKAFDIIREVLSDNSVSAGAFDIRIASPELRFRVIEAGANLRSRSTSIPYGDQGMFMKKNCFEKVGGFPDLPIMEDIEISRKLRNAGKIVFVKPPLMTSARRWLKEGSLYTTLRDWVLVMLYYLMRAAPEKLKAYYKDIR